ncbi:hypothetical protein Tco_0577056 [Tanacetum coccineum]
MFSVHLSCPIHEHSTITILNGARESTVSAPKWARHTSERGTSAPPSPDYVPGPEAPPSPDYVPGPEAPPSPIYIPYVPEPEYPEFMPPEDHVFPAEEQPLPAVVSPTADSPGYIPESDPEEEDEEDPEEDPAYYPADIGDDDEEDEEELHLTTTHEAAHDAMGNIARKDDDINTAEGPRSENQRAEMWESEGSSIYSKIDLRSGYHQLRVPRRRHPSRLHSGLDTVTMNSVVPLLYNNAPACSWSYDRGKANVVMMLELGKDREPLRFRALSDDYWLGLPINKYLNAQTEEKSWRTSRWRMLEGMLVENSKDPEKF